jgi:aminopeptidase N
VREQRASVEDSLEFAAAQGVARQWWGAAVGNDPARQPVLHEALAQFSALLYVQDVRGAEGARQMQEDQLRGVYQVYRTFGGEDRAASAPSRDYRNSFQYAAIVVSKGALMLVALRAQLGDERFFKALRSYYEANRLEVAEMEDLRAAFVAEAELSQRRAVTRTFNRWLAERHGDEDIAPPNPQLAAAFGINAEPQQAPKDRNAFSRLGRFFWRQMTRIR